MKEKYETNAKTAVRIIVTIQDGTNITTSSLWINKEMLGDVYRERGITAFRRKIRESLEEQNKWTSDAIQEGLGFVGGPVGGETKRWWRRLFGG